MPKKDTKKSQKLTLEPTPWAMKASLALDREEPIEVPDPVGILITPPSIKVTAAPTTQSMPAQESMKSANSNVLSATSPDKLGLDDVKTFRAKKKLPVLNALMNTVNQSKFTVYGSSNYGNQCKALEARGAKRNINQPARTAKHKARKGDEVSMELIDPSIIDKQAREWCYEEPPVLVLETLGPILAGALFVITYSLPVVSFILDVSYLIPEEGKKVCTGYLYVRCINATSMALMASIFVWVNIKRRKVAKWKAEQHYVLIAMLVLLFENGKQAIERLTSKDLCDDDFSIMESADLHFVRIMNFAYSFIMLEVFASNPARLPGLPTHLFITLISLGELLFVAYVGTPESERAREGFEYQTMQWFENVRLILLANKTYMAYMALARMSYLRTRSRQMTFWLMSGPFLIDCILKICGAQLVDLHRVYHDRDSKTNSFFGEMCVTELKFLLYALVFLAPSEQALRRHENGLRIVRLEASLIEEMDASKAEESYHTGRVNARRNNMAAMASDLEKNEGEDLRPTFCLQTACWAFNCSYIVYFDEPNIGLASEMKPEDLEHCRIKLRKFVTDKITGSYAAIFSEREKPWNIYLAFRGTSSLNDVLTDIKGWAKLVDFGRDDEFKFWVHSGFYHAYKTVGALARMALDEYIQGLLSTGIASSQVSICFCGHSLGGAIATLMAVHSTDWLQSIGITRLRCYTFGAPRVGDSNFASYANSRIQHIFRIVGSEDPVPRVPGKKVGALMLLFGFPIFLKCLSFASDTDKDVLLFYKHVGYEVVINRSLSGDLVVNPHPSDYLFFLNARPVPTAHLLPSYRDGLLASIWQLRGDDALFAAPKDLATE